MTAGAADPWTDALDLPRDDGLLGHVVRLNVVVDQVLDDVTSRFGITVADYLVLAVVRRSPGHRSSPTAICAVLGRTSGGMSLALDRLEAAGRLRRRADPTDGRRVVVQATALGIRLATDVNAALHEWEASLRTTPNQRDQIGRSLDQLTTIIRRRIDEAHEDTARSAAS